MPWITLPQPSDCAVCGIPTTRAFVSTQYSPFWSLATGIETAELVGAEYRCLEHGGSKHRHPCRHGTAFEANQKVTVPSVQTKTQHEKLNLAHRVTYRQATVERAGHPNVLDDRRNKKHD